MRWCATPGVFSLLALGAVILGAGWVRAEAPHGEHDAADKERLKYQATIHENGKEDDREFDLAKEDDRRQLGELLQRGDVVELAQHRPVNILALRWDLGLWTLVVFLLLLFILSRIAWKPMLEGLRKREETIRGSLEEAQRARADAQRMQQEFQRQMDQAQERVRDTLDEGRREAQRLQEEMLAKARSDIQAERDRLRREIERARDQAVQELWNQTARLATMVSAKAIGRQINEDDHRRLVDEAINDLKAGGDGRRPEPAGSPR